ncbi:tyrosinase family protein [Pseudoduganella dura]|uniref:tyrosinase family protein n=1 Tax=Pseudoduganella dura TaxID=321982 RepID=UPI00167207D1|nr:tyrosinase family protein [Pseudoduganella dura]GGY20209.1 hypothetical protein GCM10007386_56690 [Pseudoduganella dura]
MSTFSRREFLKTGGLAAGLVLLPSVGAAAQNCVMTRYSLASNKGRRMLQTYADSVWRMNNPLTQPEASPRSWMFQWYTHMVRGDRGKAAELSRVYPLGGTAMALANEMWNTCQSHLGQPQQYFLPWHRMYLRYLEEIVRAVSGDPCFTMPYWDYTDPAQQALPVEFRQRFHPRWGALYREERYPEINAGTPLPAGRAGFGLNLDCMKSGSYNPFNGDAGFCANIDGMVHGAAHLDIGTQLGMATVPWAASDPVFWVHHCNIDRIWASWNRLGGRNPSDPAFLDKAFVFANGGGTRAETQIRDAVSVPAAAYDTYLSRPPGSLPFQGAASQGAASLDAEQKQPAALETNEAGVDGNIDIGNAPATVALVAGAALDREPPGSQAPWRRPGAQVIVSIEGRTATGFVPVAFNVYLHGTRNGPLKPGTPAHIGQLHFFGLETGHGQEGHDGNDGHGPDGPESRDISFVLRNDTRAYLAGLDPRELAVTFVPVGVANGPWRAAVRRVALVVR